MKWLRYLIALLLPSMALAKGTATDQITMSTQASPTCTSGRACIYAKTTGGLVYVVDANGLELGSNSARNFRHSTNCSGLSSPALGDVCYDSTLDRFLYYTASGWGVPGESAFVRTCTITSAAAATPVVCLLDADVGAGRKAYLAGWHAKVNGATAWATTASCSITDTASVGFASIAVAAMTGNAFIGDLTANVTLSSAYSLGSGSSTAKGLEIVCNANGTGSNLVVTLFGVIK